MSNKVRVSVCEYKVGLVLEKVWQFLQLVIIVVIVVVWVIVGWYGLLLARHNLEPRVTEASLPKLAV